jgi:trk system potassium uptake protein TrkA
MRIVFVGATDLTTMTARRLIAQGHDVVIIERDKTVIDTLNADLDCSFLHGDGTKPQILREAKPEQCDVLFCLTRHAQENIIASLVGRSLGFKRVVTSIDDEEFEGICHNLGLEHTIVPSRTVSRYLADMVRGVDVIELSTFLKGSARLFSFVARSEDAVHVTELGLPEHTRVVCLYRGEEFVCPTETTKVRQGDEVVLITDNRHLTTLRERWRPLVAEQRPDSGGR